ncbi:LysE family translocator [Radicibacter daui]|uniref:LysE family translocator n=1 Tax=Radicibacter daui TaxID=3064829 RepID=UPI004046EBE6
MVETLLSFALFTVVTCFTPGGANMLATASGAHFGYRRSLPVMTGIAIGLGAMTAAAAGGLAGMLMAAPTLQLYMKIAGTAYLLWLALRIARSGPPHLSRSMTRPQHFFSGLWMQCHNPKGWAIALGAAATFAGLSASPGGLALLFGPVFFVAALSAMSLWCLAGQWLSKRLRQGWHWRAFNITLGLALATTIAPLWLP